MKAILLAVSVALNLVLGVICLTKSPVVVTQRGTQLVTLSGTPVTGYAQGQTTTREAASPAAQALWRGDTKSLYDQLRAWGAPRDIILAVLIAKDKDECDKRRLAILYPEGVNRWTGQRAVGRDFMVKMNEAYAERRAEARKVMGEDFDVALAEGDPMNRIKWGNLTHSQMAQIKELGETYEAAQAKGRPVSGSLQSAAIEWQKTLDAEYEQDVRAILGSQADDYLTFNSFGAKLLQNELTKASINVDEETYRRLLKATTDLRASFKPAEGFDDVFAKSAAQAKVYESVLGAEHSLKIVGASDALFRNLDGLMTAQPARERMAFYQQYAQAMSRITAVQGDPAKRTFIMGEAERLYGELVKRVPMTQVNAFLNSPQGRPLRGLMQRQ